MTLTTAQIESIALRAWRAGDLDLVAACQIARGTACPAPSRSDRDHALRNVASALRAEGEAAP